MRRKRGHDRSRRSSEFPKFGLHTQMPQGSGWGVPWGKNESSMAATLLQSWSKKAPSTPCAHRLRGATGSLRGLSFISSLGKSSKPNLSSSLTTVIPGEVPFSARQSEYTWFSLSLPHTHTYLIPCHTHTHTHTHTDIPDSISLSHTHTYLILSYTHIPDSITHTHTHTFAPKSSKLMSQSIHAAITKVLQIGWLKQQTLISQSSGGWKVQDLGADSDESPLPSSWQPSSHCNTHSTKRPRVSGRAMIPRKDSIPIISSPSRGPTS